MRKPDFVEIGFAGRTDFIVVRYSATNSGVPSNSQFRFQGNVFKVIIRKCVQFLRTAFQPTFLILKT
jgi:hypothetical protein